MTEVEFCGEGFRARLNNEIVCLWGAALPRILRSGGGEGRPSLWRAQGGVLLPVGVGFPPSLVGVGEEGRGRRREGKGGRPPPQLGLGLGARPLVGRLLLSPTKAQ